jgi:hypothetical protein
MINSDFLTEPVDELSRIIDSKLYYSSLDFKGQDYVVTENIRRGEFSVPLRNISGKRIGWLSWQSLAYPAEDDRWPVQENLIISFGTEHNAETFHGTALSLARNGYYETNVPYNFCVSNCKEKINITITKEAGIRREIIVSR